MHYLITNVRMVYEYFYQQPENYNLFNGDLMFADYLINGDDTVILCLDKNKIIAFCLLRNIEENKWVKEAISVLQKYRRQGIATQLIYLAYDFVDQNKGYILEGNYSKDGYKYLYKINMQLKTNYAKI